MPETFLLWPSTLYSFLFKDMLKCLLLIERKWVAQTMHPKERETIAIKPHYRACVSILWRTDPHQSDSAMMPSTTIGPNVSIDAQSWVAKNEDEKYLHYFSDDTASIPGSIQCPNRQYFCDPHEKEGQIVCLFDLQCQQFAKIMGRIWIAPWKRCPLKTNWNISATKKLSKPVLQFCRPQYYMAHFYLIQSEKSWPSLSCLKHFYLRVRLKNTRNLSKKY